MTRLAADGPTLHDRLADPALQAPLLQLAADVIDKRLGGVVIEDPDPARVPAPLDEVAGVETATFVTLERGRDLLGCIGTILPVRPLVADVAGNAIAAAFHDPRLPAVTRDDWSRMSIKISVLTPLSLVRAATYLDLAQRVRPGVDGLLVTAGRNRGTLLPAVWPKVPDTVLFLDLLWRKAGLPKGYWGPDVRVERYRTLEFCDPGPR